MGGTGPPNLNLQLSRSVTTASLGTSSLANLVLMKPSMYLFGHSSPLLLLPYRSTEGRVSLNPAVEGKWVRPWSTKGAFSILLLLKPLPLIWDNTSRGVPDWRNSLSPLPKILSATLQHNLIKSLLTPQLALQVSVFSGKVSSVTANLQHAVVAIREQLHLETALINALWSAAIKKTKLN